MQNLESDNILDWLVQVSAGLGLGNYKTYKLTQVGGVGLA